MGLSILLFALLACSATPSFTQRSPYSGRSTGDNLLLQGGLHANSDECGDSSELCPENLLLPQQKKSGIDWTYALCRGGQLLDKIKAQKPGNPKFTQFSDFAKYRYRFLEDPGCETADNDAYAGLAPNGIAIGCMLVDRQTTFPGKTVTKVTAFEDRLEALALVFYVENL